jgi:hypothetical protein
LDDCMACRCSSRHLGQGVALQSTNAEVGVGPVGPPPGSARVRP